MARQSWDSITAETWDSGFKQAPLPRSHYPCHDPKGHQLLRYYMGEYDDEVCGWCDPQHAYPGWHCIVDALQSPKQLALVQQLRQKEAELLAKKAKKKLAQPQRRPLY